MYIPFRNDPRKLLSRDFSSSRFSSSIFCMVSSWEFPLPCCCQKKTRNFFSLFFILRHAASLKWRFYLRERESEKKKIWMNDIYLCSRHTHQFVCVDVFFHGTCRQITSQITSGRFVTAVNKFACVLSSWLCRKIARSKYNAIAKFVLNLKNAVMRHAKFNE